MRGVQKFLAVFAVLAIGVGAALPFRRDEPLTVPSPVAANERSDSLVRRQHVPLSVSLGDGNSPAVGLDYDNETPPTAAARVAAASEASPAIDAETPPPALARRYQPVADPLGPAPARLEPDLPASFPASPATSGSADQPPAIDLGALAAERQRIAHLTMPPLEPNGAPAASDPYGSAPALLGSPVESSPGSLAPQRRVTLRTAPAAEPNRLAAPPVRPAPRLETAQGASDRAADRQIRWQRHRIVDGDTLPALALRYLGSESRADEIYQANAQRLPSPHVLPLGVEINVPVPDSRP